MQYLMKFVLLLVSTACVVSEANNSTTHKFLLMVASGSSPDSSAVKSAVDQTLEQINMTFSFQLKYNISDTQVNVAHTKKQPQWILYTAICNSMLFTVQCDKSNTKVLQCGDCWQLSGGSGGVWLLFCYWGGGQNQSPVECAGCEPNSNRS